jgi:hypothetical protein
MSKSRGDIDFVGHAVIPVEDLKVDNLTSINNILWKATNPDQKWVEEVTEQIALSRAKMRSTYIRWSLSINGLTVASEKYKDSEWSKHHEFIVTSLRPDLTGKGPNGGVNVDIATIAKWKGDYAASAHLSTIPMITSYGLIDIYSNLEEVIFNFYRTFLMHQPESIIKGDDFKPLRKLRKQAHAGEIEMEIWTKAIHERIDLWQRKKLYDGLGKVFKSFCELTQIKRPSVHTHTTIDSWVSSINTIGLVRNALVHGVTVVSKELATACKSPFAMTFDFEENDPLEIKLYHLQGVELFCEQLFDALNISLIELMVGPISKPKSTK